MHSSSLRLCYSGPGCATRLENHRVDLDREIQNLTDIVSFSCVRSKLVSYVSFMREWYYSTTCSSRLDAHPHRSNCSCC